MSRRGLAVLLAVTVLIVAAAFWALLRHGDRTAGQFQPGPLFPGLADRAAAVAQIDVASRDSTVHVKRADQGRWVVTTKSDYPANADQVHRTIFALLRARITDRATALPENHRAVGLVAPDKGGAATRVVLLDEAGSQLAALLIGKPLDTEALPTGPQSYFVRKAGDDQVWVAQGDFPIEADIRSWLDPQILSIARARIQSTTVRFPDGSTYAVSRKAPDQPDFVLRAVPRGREPAPVTDIANALGNAPSALSFDDVKPAAKLPFPDQAEHVTYRTFDGLAVDVALAKVGDGTWATFAASVQEPEAASPPAAAEAKPEDAARTTAPATPDQTAAAKPEPPLKSPEAVRNEADTINRRVTGWAYLLPEPVARDLSHPLEDLLVPAQKPAEAAPAKGKPAKGKSGAKPKRDGKRPPARGK